MHWPLWPFVWIAFKECLLEISGDTVALEIDLRAIAQRLPGVLADETLLASLSKALGSKGRKAVAMLNKALAPLSAEPYDSCIEHLFLNRTSRAVACFITHHGIKRDPNMKTKDTGGEPASATLLKLRHDTEMYEYLEAQGFVSSAFKGVGQLYRSVLNSATERYGSRPMAGFHVNGMDTNPLWRKTWDRSVVWGREGTAERLQQGVLSEALKKNADEITKEYRKGGRGIEAECADQDGWVVVDDVLKPEALVALQKFLVESTFYYTPKMNGRYLMAALEDGLASPIILQLVEELRAAFPMILGRHHLRMAWAFKYDNTLAKPGETSEVGVPIHADAAAVNVNFWMIDPGDESDSESGGLTLYQAEAPANEKFGTYNNAADQPALRELCSRSPRNEITYRPNRLVMFNSNLFHATQPMKFPREFPKRRINLTLLFGDRCGKYTGDQV